MREYIYKGKAVSLYRRDQVNINGVIFKPEVLEVLDGASVFAINDNNEIYIAKQHRFGLDNTTYELPGGGVDIGEDPHSAAIRELEEEVGVTATNLEFMFKASPSPAWDCHTVYVYLATGITESNQKLDQDEDIKIEKIDLERFMKSVHNSEIVTDMTTIATLNYYYNFRSSK